MTEGMLAMETKGKIAKNRSQKLDHHEIGNISQGDNCELYLYKYY